MPIKLLTVLALLLLPTQIVTLGLLEVARPTNMRLLADSPSPAVIRATQRKVVFVRPAKEKACDKNVNNWSGVGAIITEDGIVIFPRRIADDTEKIELLVSTDRKFVAKPIVSDAKVGVTVCRIVDEKPFPTLEVSDSDKVAREARVFSVGLASDDETSVERGVVVGTKNSGEKFGELIFVETAKSTPSSSDLLFNCDGKLIGIWSREGREGAVPINRVKEVVKEAMNAK